MRFDDWDVILFPTGRDSKIPVKEFKVACHVVPDLELSHINGSGMPVVTCFVPSLAAGAPFQISIHCWRNPEISQFTRNYSKHTELVKFEARVLLDGRLVASAILDRKVNGPHLVTTTFEFTKTGELERLKFPTFRREILHQNYWNANDDMGRIKVIISEGFPRDSLSVPIERVKNIVTFSFQHAPLEVLESSGIAWPNPLMWRRALEARPQNLETRPLNASSPMPMPPPMVPTYHPDDGADLHAHSPRRKPLLRPVKSQGFPMGGLYQQASQPQTQGQSLFGFQQPSHASSFSWFPRGGQAAHDPFSESAYLEWVASNMANMNNGNDGKAYWPSSMLRNGLMRLSGDGSMDEYRSHCGESMHLSGPSLEVDDAMVGSDGSGCGSSMGGGFVGGGGLGGAGITLKVPTNTPITVSGGQEDSEQMLFNNWSWSDARKDAAMGRGVGTGTGFGGSSWGSGNIQPGSGAVFSENCSRSNSAGDRELATAGVIGGGGGSGGTFLAETTNSGGTGTGNTGMGGLVFSERTSTKRTRTFTPASARAIDEEDEPRRVSPHVRMAGFGVVDVGCGGGAGVGGGAGTGG
ncbi:hypothetical protein QBC42DRAFT_326778, partial [Cladorrhinum samala]